MDTSITRQTEDPPADTDALLKNLQREAQYDQKWTLVYNTVATLSSCVAFLMLFILIMSRKDPKQDIPFLYFLLASLFFGSVGMTAWHLERRRKQRKQRLLQKLGTDNREIGPLLLLMHPEQSEDIEQMVGDVLKRRLPCLQAEDFARLQTQHIEALLGMLVSKDKQLVLEVLKILEQIGDRRALAPVATLMAQTDKIHVRRAAKDCLSLLTTRAEQQEQATTLLRPTDQSSVSPETLLRPTQSNNTETPKEQLLRTVVQDGDNP